MDLSYSALPLEPLPSRVEPSDSLASAFYQGTQATFMWSAKMVQGVWQLITGKLPLGAVGGPIMIAKVAGDSAKAGLQKFFEMMSLISINLAIVNLIPIPLLDGGQIVVVCIELIRRKPMSIEALEIFINLVLL